MPGYGEHSVLADVSLMVVMTIIVIIRYHGGISHTSRMVIIRIGCGRECEGVPVQSAVCSS